MEESICNMISNALGKEKVHTLGIVACHALQIKIQERIDTEVKIALEEFATESIVVIKESLDSKVGSTGLSVHITQYYEEGSLPLNLDKGKK